MGSSEVLLVIQKMCQGINSRRVLLTVLSIKDERDVCQWHSRKKIWHTIHPVSV